MNHAFIGGEPPRQWNAVAPLQTDLVDLIAVSGPIHCIDGWGLLGRALSSLVVGDPHAARHFAYYAELRAALSILNLSGVGIFNSWNCTVDANGIVQRADRPGRARPFGTHQMAWLAIEEWTRSQYAGSVIGDAMTLRSISFSDCLQSMWPGNTLRPIAYDLILKWGFDLGVSFADRDARNQSSYVPQLLNPIAAPADITFEHLQIFWEMFEPDSADPFLSIDRYLFRTLVETQYSILGGNPAFMAGDLSGRYDDLDPAVQNVISKEFLCRIHQPGDPDLLINAQTRTALSRPIEMIGRASLLLRSASAITRKSLIDAGVGRLADLAFWSQPFGSHMGFWAGTNSPSQFYELWDDVKQALDDVEILKNNATPNFQRSDWLIADFNGLPHIFEAERIALWGLCG